MTPRRGRPPKSPDIVNRIVALYRAGVTVDAICCQLRVCRDTVTTYARRAGLSRSVGNGHVPPVPRPLDAAVTRPALARRCQADGCYQITTAARCPGCGAAMYVVEVTDCPAERAQRYQPGM